MELSGIGLLAAVSAGAISFLSPCVLPLVPGYLSFVAGQSLDELRSAPSAGARLSAVGLSLCFVLGFSTVFVLLGASATVLGQLLLRYRYELSLLAGVVVIVFGLFTSGLLKLGWLERELRFHGEVQGGRPAGAYVLGVAFALGWTPCIGPVLGAILTLSAGSATVASGAVLLGAYSLGLGLPFLLAALFTEELLRRLTAMRRAGRALKVGAGAVMVLMGLAMITGELSAFSYWLLETFPSLATIG
jgi:cytochrome c-type biogenesis protein